jgi:hypothetical protein
MKLSRRNLIKSAGAWALLGPVLASRPMNALAETNGPRRVIVIFSPNGPILERGPATGTETNFDLLEWWDPLQRHKADGNFFTGLYQAGVPFGEHNEHGHQSAGTGALTARTTEKTDNATGPSLDQFIGQELERAGMITPKRSVLWGLHDSTGKWGPWYEDAGKPVNPLHNPWDALADLLPYVATDNDPSQLADLSKRHLVLDRAWQDCSTLRGQLDSTGKEILDFHCSNIESLERSVTQAIQQQGRVCTAPDAPATTLPADTNFNQRSTRDEAMNAWVEMTALALTCDLTRVVGLSFGKTAARLALPESYAIPESAKVDSGDSGLQHHAWTHAYDGGEQRRQALREFTRWYSEWVAKLLDKLKTTFDADGRPLLDTTLVLWTSELGYSDRGGPHPNGDIPVMLFGNGDGAFQTGRLFQIDEGSRGDKALPLHALFVSVCRHMGLGGVDTFGNAGAGPLDWLVG